MSFHLNQFDHDFQNFAADKARERRPIKVQRVDLCAECTRPVLPHQSVMLDPVTSELLHADCHTRRRVRREKLRAELAKDAARSTRALVAHGTTDAAARIMAAFAERFEARASRAS